jgi:hypothetical protein
MGICLKFHFDVLFQFLHILIHFVPFEYVIGLQSNLVCGQSFLEFGVLFSFTVLAITAAVAYISSFNTVKFKSFPCVIFVNEIFATAVSYHVAVAG